MVVAVAVVIIIMIESILTLCRLGFRRFAPWGREAPGTHFRTLFPTLGRRAQMTPVAGPRNPNLNFTLNLLQLRSETYRKTTFTHFFSPCAPGHCFYLVLLSNALGAGGAKREKAERYVRHDLLRDAAAKSSSTTHTLVENLLMPLFLVGCFPEDSVEGKQPIKAFGDMAH